MGRRQEERQWLGREAEPRPGALVQEGRWAHPKGGVKDSVCVWGGRLKVGEGCPKEADLGDGDPGPTRSGRRGGLS